MTSELILTRIYETLCLMTELSNDLSSHTSAEPLNDLFDAMRHSEDPHVRAESEDLIWALWCSHEDEHAHNTMQKAIGALARKELEESRRLLDNLVLDWPDWAEAWNKRATVNYLLGRFDASVLDIQKTLELEPRHFGALSGLGLINLPLGREREALKAFEAALRIHPNLPGANTHIRELRKKVRGKEI